ncbi:hypothetical protein M0P65_04310 [Candidatus Gracilibacteria bacterium]|nr:hypothetical protein [Candidatus Gracilibacteria bacterium]
MPNQTPHTPSTQQSHSPSLERVGGGLYQIKPPVITEELQRLVEENKKLIKTALPAMEENERRKEEERLKQQEFIEINGIKLETKNLGRPQNPTIQINPTKASETISQAWEHDGNWYYNFNGAQQEAKYLGKRIPTKEEWEEIVEEFGRDGERLSLELNMPMAGSRHYRTGLNNDQGTSGYYLSSSLSDTHSFILHFGKSIVIATGSSNCAHGFSVRCIFPEKKESKPDSILEFYNAEISDKIFNILDKKSYNTNSKLTNKKYFKLNK